ncbi:MAG: hypothetical protein HFF52_04755 [Lawsonibacter sp.]|nr:hypothetical protein [Lawsonibacter sp.]
MLISAVFSLFSTLTALAVLSAPFCVIQLALCRFCPWKPVRLAPLFLFGGGFLWSWRYLSQAYEWENLLGMLVMLPCILGLTGSGAGWYLWKKRPRC